MKRYFYLMTMIAFIFVISGCVNYYNNEGEGAGLGGVLGAVAGGVIGHQSDDTAAGVLIGGAIGAASGAVIGSQIQKPGPYPYPQPVPVVVAQPVGTVGTAQGPLVQDQSIDSFMIHVLNDNGGYTVVVIKRSGSGFVGPQGEYYTQFPSMSQLKVMYGK